MTMMMRLLFVAGWTAGLVIVSAVAAADPFVAEAESATLSPGLEAHQHGAASGGARVRGFDRAGESLTFAGAKGGRWCVVRYSLATGITARCTVATGESETPITFRNTGSWNRYASAIVQLPATVDGSMTLELSPADVRANGNQSCAAIDRIELHDDPPPIATSVTTLREQLVAAALATGSRNAERWFASLRDDGSWEDIDYRAVTRDHFQRVREMAVFWAADQAARADYPAKIRLALEYWFREDFRHSNWWVNHIAIPQPLADTVLLLDDALPAGTRGRADRIFHHAWPPPEGRGTGQGANLFYRIYTAVRMAAIKRDGGMTAYVFDRAFNEIRITSGEGIQQDFSFHQHGPHLHTGSYGLAFIGPAVEVIRLGRGTAYSAPPGKVELLSALILDHLQWMIRGECIDFGSQGRNFSRSSAHRGASGVAGWCRTLAACEVPRAAEFVALADRIQRAENAPPYPTGNRAFWRSDFMCHQRPGWYASAKMFSKRTTGSEGGNGEGLKQFHMPDGSCFLMQRGDEYANLQPVLDYRRIPGITCEQDSDLFPRIDWGRNMRGTTMFAGGTSDGRYGVAGFDFRKDRVTARKSWFFFDDCVVALGAGITCTGDAPVMTTINQCRLVGPVTISDGKVETLESGERSTGPTCAVMHDGIGYVIRSGAGGGSIRVRAGEQSGTWKAINNGYSPDTVNANVMQLVIDHGVKPSGDAGTYVYAAFPDRSLDGLARLADRMPRVLANSAKLQAVHDNGCNVTGIVFYEPGHIELPDIDGAPATIATTRACIVHLSPGENGTRQLCVSCPDYRWQIREPETLQLSLAGKWSIAAARDETARAEAGDESTTVHIEATAGRTVVITLGN